MMNHWNYCAECGRKLESEWKHCPGCGREVGMLGVLFGRSTISAHYNWPSGQQYFLSPTIGPTWTQPTWSSPTFTCSDPGMLLTDVQSCGMSGAKSGNVPTAIRTMLHPDGNDRKEPLR